MNHNFFDYKITSRESITSITSSSSELITSSSSAISLSELNYYYKTNASCNKIKKITKNPQNKKKTEFLFNIKNIIYKEAF